MATGMRVMAIRRDREWNIEVDGDDVLVPGDVLFLEGSPAGITRRASSPNAPLWQPAAPPGTARSTTSTAPSTCSSR